MEATLLLAPRVAIFSMNYGCTTIVFELNLFSRYMRTRKNQPATRSREVQEGYRRRECKGPGRNQIVTPRGILSPVPLTVSRYTFPNGSRQQAVSRPLYTSRQAHDEDTNSHAAYLARSIICQWCRRGDPRPGVPAARVW